MLLNVHPDNPQSRNIKTIVETLQKGGIIIYPTDTIYGLGCSIFEHKAIERICQIKNINPQKAQLSFICYDLGSLSRYTKSISTPLYRILKSHLPGPYTFILPASKEVPKILKSKKDTIGLRVPDNNIARTIIKELGYPILSASLPGEMVEEYTDPELMYANFRDSVDIVVDGGMGGMVPSTIVDCTTEPPVVVREGLGTWNSLLMIFFLLFSSFVQAQPEIKWLKEQTAVLAGPAMYGRGYVNGGGEKAAMYINGKFREFGLKSFNTINNYYQPYTFPVNTFPGAVSLQINGRALQPGKDFLVHAASTGISFRSKKVLVIDLAGVKDSIAWNKIRNGFKKNAVYLLRNIDTLMLYKKLTIRSLANEFKLSGCYIIPMSKKLIWLATNTIVPSTIIYLTDSIMPGKIKSINAHIQSRFIRAFPTQNLIGFVPGLEKPDSFIVFTAHYDHLGKMGKEAVFPGANDNASGVSLLLYLANFYALHPQKYSIAFMAFSGEEAGLIGSKYYVEHPVFSLQKICFLFNFDMVGDATNGITVVNALAQPAAFSLLEKINAEKKYLPAIYKRDQTRNSDHYPFSEKGVKAVYIYTNGVKPYYHDLKDTPEEVKFENVEGLIKLMEDYLSDL